MGFRLALHLAISGTNQRVSMAKLDAGVLLSWHSAEAGYYSQLSISYPAPTLHNSPKVIYQPVASINDLARGFGAATPFRPVGFTDKRAPQPLEARHADLAEQKQ